MTQLANKTALVTGGRSGIGLAIARAFLDEGARVAISGRQETKLRQAAESLPGGERLLIYPANVAQADQVRKLVDLVQNRLGAIDILVNNAGLNVRQRALR